AGENQMAMTTGGNNGISAEMNVTPMIDILLVLLVIFMIIVPLEHGEKAEIPQPSNSDASPPRQDAHIVIQVTMSGTEPNVKINKDAVEWDKLEGRLQELLVQRGDKTGFVKGERTMDLEW